MLIFNIFIYFYFILFFFNFFFWGGGKGTSSFEHLNTVDFTCYCLLSSY